MLKTPPIAVMMGTITMSSLGKPKASRFFRTEK